jgi:hypothetical protein
MNEVTGRRNVMSLIGPPLLVATASPAQPSAC